MNQQLQVFKFNPSQSELRSLAIDGTPWMVAKDVCDALGLSDTNKALSPLDEDEKLTRKLFVSGQNRNMWLVNESGLYNLIFRSNKPEAKAFRKWVTGEVLPALRTKGSYTTPSKPAATAIAKATDPRQGDYIDARDISFSVVSLNGATVRCINIQDQDLYSINDVCKAIGADTAGHQIAAKLNKKRTMAHKVFLFANTHPAWMCTITGVNLILSGSRRLKSLGKIVTLKTAQA